MPTPPELSFIVEGMTCDHCATTLRGALEALPGVRQADVSYAERRATVQSDGTVPPDTIVAAAAAKGYTATRREAPPEHGRRRAARDGAFDLVIVGSGGAAFGAALRASELGARVAMVERATLGGTCVNIGCVPSKTLIRAAEAVHRANHPRFAGVAATGRLADFRALMAEKQDLVEGLRTAKYADVLASTPGVELVRGSARFAGPGRVVVGERELRSERFVVATGMRPHAADFPGLAEAGALTSTEALALDTLPRSMIVLGGRFIALELAQAFARLGTKVTVVQRSAHLLPTEDDDVTEELERLLVAEGVGVLTSSRVIRVLREGAERVVEVERHGERIRLAAEQLLVATGRRANTEDLGLESIGARLRADGTLVVAETLETTALGVFAAGDVIGDPAFVYTAAYEGRLAAENALTTSKQPRDYTALPAVVFTDPQLATVGLNETQARALAVEVDVAKLPFAHVPRALAARDTRGFVKLLRARGTDRLVGAVILAPEAGDLIMEPALALRHGIPVSALARAFHPYLTGSEAIKLAAQAFDKDVARLSCCAA
ncbi:MAG: mercury(II) reductase [Deltaproteobacteria bacterium]|nr:mercury(II) reductase [Deltaproteobacteria bacterium]